MLVADCIACRHGNHSGHVEWPQKPPPGVFGGHKCECKGDCAERYKPRPVVAALPDPFTDAFGEAARLREELENRRECFAGALADIESLISAVENLEASKATPEGFASFVRLTAEGRKPLLELAIRQVDAALSPSGDER